MRNEHIMEATATIRDGGGTSATYCSKYGRTDSIERVRTICSAFRRGGLVEEVEYVRLERVGRRQAALPRGAVHAWVGRPSADEQAEEFWETLSYAVIWLCGLSGIALCFR